MKKFNYFMRFFLLLSQTHVTHSTSIINRWISTVPRAMCLFFLCHWCHFCNWVTSVTWHFCLSLHRDILIIRELQYSCYEWHEFSNVEKISSRFSKTTWCFPKTSANLPQLFFNNLKCFFNFHPNKLFPRYHPERKFSTE